VAIGLTNRGECVRFGIEAGRTLSFYSAGRKLMADIQENPLGCGEGCREVEVPIEQELKALNALRAIKSQVREIKKQISDLTENQGQDKDEKIKSLELQLAELKQDWNRWDVKRKEAARIRMIMLGHEEPP
jgi:hypothetical protein